jgi:hypothetical protein
MGLMLGLLGAGAAVGVGAYVVSRVRRRGNIAEALGVPPGALVRELSAAEVAKVIEILGDPPANMVGIWTIKQQFAKEGSYSVTMPDGSVWVIVEESSAARMLGQAPARGVSGFIAGA